jgi:hypothetical protein
MGNESHMEEVAAIFGKKLGEDFIIKRSFGFDFEGHFSEKGFEYWGEDMNGKCWYSDNGRLVLEMLTGRAVIIDEA